MMSTGTTRLRAPRSISARAFVRALIATVALAVFTPAPAAKERSRWDGVERVVAIGDLHGRDDALDELLASSGLVGPGGDWNGGKAHLVVTGDFLDRGGGERKIMDRLMKLQKQAPRAGGRVHVLLANHEVMNLIGDWRYVSLEGYDSFRSMEIGQVRHDARRDREKRLSKRRAPTERATESFDDLFPPGYFGRRRALARNGRYGKWLLQRPTVVVINGVVYVHGGLVPEIASWGADTINDHVREALTDHLRAAEALTEYGWFDEAMTLDERRELAQAIVRQRDEFPGGARAVQAADRYLAYWDDRVFGAEGPFWFRGYCQDDEWLLESTLNETLESMRARAMAVGHTPTDHGDISIRFDGRLVRMDVGMAYGVPARAVEWFGDRPRVRNGHGVLADPRQDPAYGESLSQTTLDLPPETISTWLRESGIDAIRPLGRGHTNPEVVTLRRGRERFLAVFKSMDEDGGDRFAHEIAAYRVSERLGWNLVPPTVGRIIEDRPGSLQLWIGGSISEKKMRKRGVTHADKALASERDARRRVFDALIGNPARNPEDLLWRLREGELWLVDNARAFSIAAGVQWPPPGRLESVEPAWLDALSRITSQWAGSALADLLSEAQIDALVARAATLRAQFSEDGAATAAAASR